MNCKKTFITLSLLFLGLTIFVGCETTPIEDEQEIDFNEQSTNKEDVGNSGGNDDDDDYN